MIIRVAKTTDEGTISGIGLESVNGTRGQEEVGILIHSLPLPHVEGNSFNGVLNPEGSNLSTCQAIQLLQHNPPKCGVPCKLAVGQVSFWGEKEITTGLIAGAHLTGLRGVHHDQVVGRGERWAYPDLISGVSDEPARRGSGNGESHRSNEHIKPGDGIQLDFSSPT